MINKIDKDKLKKELFWWVKAMFVIVCLTYFITQKIVVLANIPSGSMENTIKEKDLVLADRLAYKDSEPQRGDIAIFYAPDEVGVLYIKRVIGLPGEKIVINDSKIYIDDSEVPLEENYLKEKWTLENGYYEYEVPPNCYFMLGDNRNGSLDARSWSNTFVNRNAIIAKAKYIYFPFKDIKSLDNND